ncbi:fructosamine kinase family protein [Halococcus hamelinensis]|uniref:Fructosamine/Ketosamine-3-kinase n=1 Tax=Halococcus hamelinensis 100A6 TaxID=1132509 RepID=M0M6F2_9EURY|nr:fructosamine kinase family protein [Halococcus hamelinensis]EMA41286.1 Fructosamine/Ketosamine-3-kinase [Halococcus hamelinensis 100A6]
MSAPPETEVGAALGSAPVSFTELSGGQIGTVYRSTLADGRRVVAKVGGTPLDLEGWMLRFLASHTDLPVPDVHHASSDLLVVEYVEGETSHDAAVARDAADRLAALHDRQGPSYGFERDTVVGPIEQPNPWTDSWVAFYRDHRLRQLLSAREFAPGIDERVEAVCADLDGLLAEPDSPSPIHGDVWTTNVLSRDGRVTAFLDPAVYYAHPEIELAYIDWTGTFGEAFFERYRERRGIESGFFERRRYVYRLYPLLIHVSLFGGRYHDALDATLDRLGY